MPHFVNTYLLDFCNQFWVQIILNLPLRPILLKAKKRFGFFTKSFLKFVHFFLFLVFNYLYIIKETLIHFLYQYSHSTFQVVDMFPLSSLRSLRLTGGY